jgi:tetratricopeptide (TPR) repeat protein
VKYCHNCGYKLTLGTEKFCPDCGQNFIQHRSNYDKKVSITDTGGDIIGTDVSGTGHIIGKEIGYTVQGNVINLQIGGGVSNEVLQSLQKLMTIPNQVESTISLGGREYDDKDLKEKQEAVVETKQQISQILEDINKISKKEGKEIQEIKARDLHISTKELSLKEIVLKANEHYYKKEYFEAISWYDKAIEMDPNYPKAWSNKGLTLGSLGGYKEAIACFDKALELDPNYPKAWSNKGLALGGLGRHEEAIKYFDKAIELDPNNTIAWDNKGFVLGSLGRYKEAIKYHDEAIAIDPNYPKAWYNKGLAFGRLGRYKEAIACFDKALELDPNMTDARKYRDLAYKRL